MHYSNNTISAATPTLQHQLYVPTCTLMDGYIDGVYSLPSTAITMLTNGHVF